MSGMRVGIGYDIHRLVPDRTLVLGGVEVPCDKGLLGHSDADVLTHAVMDALLGAAGIGNIGRLFPDTDPAFKNVRSVELLEIVRARMEDAGFWIVNVDANVIAEKPRLSPYVEAMRETLAARLGIPTACVSVKPRTKEGLGPEGEGEAIAAQSIVLLEARKTAGHEQGTS